MTISNNAVVENSEDFLCFETAKKKKFYNGLFFVRGKRAGLSSIEYLADSYELCGIIPFKEFYGAYSIIILSKQDNTAICFTDNSNMHCLFISDYAVSSSFLALVRIEVRKRRTSTVLNYDSLYQYYAFGKIYGRETLVDSIRQSSSNCYYKIDQGEIKELEKGIGAIGDAPTIQSYGAFFYDLCLALSDSRIALTLTGGYDSRFIFAFLKNRINIDVFISGNNYRNKDILIAKRIAKLLGKPIDVVDVRQPLIDEDFLRQEFFKYDGLLPFYRADDIRIRGFQENRCEKGYHYLLTGDGGVLHKDWEWLQDLPFYNKKYVNLRRFYRQRIAYEENLSNMGPVLLEKKDKTEEAIMKTIRQLRQDNNTKSYDYLYYYFTGNRQLNYNFSFNDMHLYAPLTEFELVKYSYNLPRMKRFFYNSMRECVTKEDKVLARIPTNYGTTESSEPLYLCRDVFFQLVQYSEKAIRLLSRTIFKKSVFVTSPMKWETYSQIRSLKITNMALEYCKDIGVVDSRTTLTGLTERQVGVILHTYYLTNCITIH